MAKPTESINWATSTNYPAGAEPEAGTPTKVVPSGHDTVGWRPEEFPPAQYLNYWMHAVQLWIQWLTSLSDARWVDFGLQGQDRTSNMVAQLDGTFLVNDTAIAGTTVALQLPAGSLVDGVRMKINGDSGSSAQVQLAIYYYDEGTRTHFGPDVGGIPLQSIVETDPPNAWATYQVVFPSPVAVPTNKILLMSLLISGQLANEFGVQSVGYRLAAAA